MPRPKNKAQLFTYDTKDFQTKGVQLMGWLSVKHDSVKAYFFVKNEIIKNDHIVILYLMYLKICYI